MAETILSYHQEDSIKLLCEIDLKKLFPDSASKEKKRFDNNWKDFLKSDLCNKEIFERKGDLLKYQSEQLIPSKSNDRPPLLLILGNPASHSVKAGMFFSFEGRDHTNNYHRTLQPGLGEKKSKKTNKTTIVLHDNIKSVSVQKTCYLWCGRWRKWTTDLSVM